MIFCIISHVIHKKQNENYFAYAPYIREMNLWLREEDKLIIVAPLKKLPTTPIDLAYRYTNIQFIPIPDFNLLTKKEIFKTFFKFPILFFQIYKGMFLANHIHLRCPGNVGLLACIIQLFFPWKKKTTKYAGNWDWNSKQPWSYRLQQKILRNTFLTKNMQVLVYGDWKETKNIKPFFTATYSEKEIEETPPRTFQSNQLIKFIYVGGLVIGKRPFLSLEVSKELNKKGIKNEIHFYGEGKEREKLEQFITKNQMQDYAILHGNVTAEEIKNAFKQSHFLLFISQSEGWPKAVAESMFWGCLPLTSAVSCVPQMLDNGKRGELIEANVDLIITKIENYLKNPNKYAQKCQNAMDWSRQFTVEKLKKEIKNLL